MGQVAIIESSPSELAGTRIESIHLAMHLVTLVAFILVKIMFSMLAVHAQLVLVATPSGAVGDRGPAHPENTLKGCFNRDGGLEVSGFWTTVIRSSGLARTQLIPGYTN